MVQLVPTGYDYISGSRIFYNEGGGGARGVQPFMITFCPPFGPESRGCSTKSYPFLVKFSNVGGLIFVTET